MNDITWESLITAIGDADVAAARARVAVTPDELPDGVQQAFRGSGITLVLGAGVSKSCGVPAWQELLLRLYAISLKDINATDVAKLAAVYAGAIEGEGPLVSARLAALSFDDDRLREEIRKILYQSTHESDLLSSIARLTNSCEGRGGVKGILSYNYDTLLEDELKKIGRQFDRRDRKDSGTNVGLPFRHVHGFLGRTVLSNEWVVLTEKQYHEEYSNPYSWSTIVQLNAYRESVCLFIGLSMSDPNLRRLLESSRQTASPRHFALLRRTSHNALREWIAASWESRGRGKGRPSGSEDSQVDERLSLICDLADSNRATALKDLGVDVIWYTEHEKLPAILEQIGA